MDPESRMEVYSRMRSYRRNPSGFIQQWEMATVDTLEEILAARARLKTTTITEEAIRIGFALVQELDIDSHRADYTMFEAARAYAAADGRTDATVDDVRAVAPMALRQRRSEFMVNFFDTQQEEDEQIRSLLDGLSQAEG
jgi:magnesium chelatase subunit I